jgi:enoyl-CoA hydratase/carnithine racemase
MTIDIVAETSAVGIAWITINRPRKHNALALPVLDALAGAVAAAGSDARTRCIVIRGAGDRYFAAGGDLVDLASVRSDAEIDAMVDRATAALDAVRNCPVPTIAYVNGDALGGGAELAVACDMRIFAAHARLGYVHGRIGISSAWGGGTDLCALIGSARAMQMMSRCEMVAAEQALAWGLANLVATSGPNGAEVGAFLDPMLERSKLVLRGIKRQSSAWRNGPGYSAARDVERRILKETWACPEHWAAVERFLAKDKE